MFMHALRVARKEIGDFAGTLIEVPTMKNGCCFPSSIALASQCFSDIQAHMQIRRNATGCPILADGSIDRQRHDMEVQFAKEMAYEIAERVSVSSPQSAGCIQRLQDGHVTEEEDIQVIAEAMDVHIKIAYRCGKQACLEAVKDFHRAGRGKVRLVLSSESLEKTGHFQPVRGASNRQLVYISVEACKLWCQVPITKDRLGAKLTILRQRCHGLHRRVKTLKAEHETLKQRVAMLESPRRQNESQNTPKRPPSAFALYCQDARRQGSLSGSVSTQAGMASKLWKRLGEQDKAEFKCKAAEALETYHEAKRRMVASSSSSPS